jgi:hypothetical protein
MTSEIQTTYYIKRKLEWLFNNILTVLHPTFNLGHLYGVTECKELLQHVIDQILEIVEILVLSQHEPESKYPNNSDVHITIILRQNVNFTNIEFLLQYIYKYGNLMSLIQLKNAIECIIILIQTRLRFLQIQPEQIESSLFEKKIKIYKICEITKTNYNSINEDECPICKENHKKGNTILTDCNHIFCKKCYKQWLSYNSTCPNCRKKMPLITIYRCS